MFESFKPDLLCPAFESYSTQNGPAKLSRACPAKVVEWRWASGDMAFAFRWPFVKELFRCNPGDESNLGALPFLTMANLGRSAVPGLMLNHLLT